MDCTIKEALSVVSEDQPIFEPSYTAAPAMHMKSEMTSPGGFTSKQSPEPTEPEWVGTAPQNAGKRGEHVNGTSRESPVDCSVTKRSRHMSNEGAQMPYQGPSYPEPRVSPQATTPPSSATEEKRVIVPADPEVWTQDHVRQWLDWAIKEYVLEQVDVMLFQALDGKALCKMTKEDMMRLTSAYNADILLSHLNYLRQSSPTFSYPTTPTNNTPPQQQPPRQVKTAHAVVRAGGEVTANAAGVLEMIDTFDRPGKAFADETYACAGTFADAFEDKPGKRLPKAGAYAAAGVGHARAEWSVFDAEAKGPNACAGAEASVGSLGAKAYAKAEIASVSASAGPVKAKVGLAFDTGVGISPTGIEAKVLGTGISFGRKMGISLFGTGFEFNLW